MHRLANAVLRYRIAQAAKFAQKAATSLKSGVGAPQTKEATINTRKRMMQDLELTGYADCTKSKYLSAAGDFVKFHWRRPSEMGQEEVRAWVEHLTRAGRIGPQLPLDKIVPGIGKLFDTALIGHVNETAEAMMTTDTRPKVSEAEVQIEGRTVKIVGFAKGAGMIEPNMATMLSLITTPKSKLTI